MSDNSDEVRFDKNLLAELPAKLPQEQFDRLVIHSHGRIERILSHGHASPAGFWYDQAEDEWVMLMKGAAILEFEDERVSLQPGDHYQIAAHRRHRVAWTSPDETTIWLAVFFDAAPR